MNHKIGRSILQVVLILLGIFVLGSWPSWKIHGSSGLLALSYATGVCGVAALLGLIPLVLSKSDRSSASGLAQACLLGTIIRLFLTLIGSIVVYKILAPLKWPFALWLVIDYIVLLIWETVAAVRLMQPNDQGAVV